jgi:hypothetical protein
MYASSGRLTTHSIVNARYQRLIRRGFRGAQYAGRWKQRWMPEIGVQTVPVAPVCKPPHHAGTSLLTAKSPSAWLHLRYRFLCFSQAARSIIIES